MTPFTLALAFVAGLLSFLNPCVLPLLPIVFAAAVSTHRLGPLALAGGLAVSFVAIGIFVASIGFSLGLDDDLRMAAAILLVAAGALLAVPYLQERMALAAGPLANWADRSLAGLATDSLAGQFLVGVLLGVVWTPCVGPTLGAASVLAAQGRDLGRVALTMSVFSLGAVLPLVAFGWAYRRALGAWRGRLLAVGRGAKTALGITLFATGMLVLTGYDKAIETALLGLSPGWLNDIATRF